jgi:hypothetical protein
MKKLTVDQLVTSSIWGIVCNDSCSNLAGGIELRYPCSESWRPREVLSLPVVVI